MKLLFCRKCGDVKKLQYAKRYCRCRESYGWYKEDGLHAIIGGKAAVIGLDNPTLSHAVLTQPQTGIGPDLRAFLFAKEHDRIETI